MMTPAKLCSNDRMVILQNGGITGTVNGKTGLSLLRYSEACVVAVIDPECAGKSLRALTRLPLREDPPIVSSLQEALPFKPTVLSIGVAPSGGRLPELWRSEVRLAAREGLNIQNGLHTRLLEDSEIRKCLRPGQWIWDMRQEPPDLSVGTGAARKLPGRRILFVGTDMNVGKMTAAIELDRAARKRGWKSKFIATGQTGMMISGEGVALDGVRVDYASGAIEHWVMRHGVDQDWLFIEGQGSLLNPASTATLPLIRGSQPTDLILVHKAGMTHLKRFPEIRIPPLKQVAALNEAIAHAAGAFGSPRVAGIALNTWAIDPSEIDQVIKQAQEETGLPCGDVLRGGADLLLDAIAASRSRTDSKLPNL